MFLRSKPLEGLVDVQGLFGNDVFCRGFVCMYGQLQFWLYAALWILILVGLPLAVSALSGERYGLKWYLPRALFPIIGSWLAYKWFQSIIHASENLLTPSQRGTAFQLTSEYMSHPVSYTVALLIVVGLAWSAYFGAKEVNMFGKGQGGTHLAENWLFLLGSLPWWYMIVRTGEMAAFTFLDFRQVLNTCDPGITIDLHDEVHAYGLGDLITFTSRFVAFYAAIVGGYMIYYQVQFHRFYACGSFLTELSMRSIVYATAWLAYLAVGFMLLFAIVAPAKDLVRRANAERLDKISNDMKEIEESDDEDKYEKLNKAQQRYDDIKEIQLSSFPFGWRKLLIAAVVKFFVIGTSVLLEMFWKHIAEKIGEVLQSGTA